MIGGRTYPAGFTRFRIGWSRTPRFGVAGALLMGDAAHPVTPAGGQGANLSVADALVIAEAAVDRPGQLLAEYATPACAYAAFPVVVTRRGPGVFIAASRPESRADDAAVGGSLVEQEAREGRSCSELPSGNLSRKVDKTL